LGIERRSSAEKKKSTLEEKKVHQMGRKRQPLPIASRHDANLIVSLVVDMANASEFLTVQPYITNDTTVKTGRT